MVLKSYQRSLSFPHDLTLLTSVRLQDLTNYLGSATSFYRKRLKTRGQRILRILQPCSILHSILCTGNTVPFWCDCSLISVERSQGFRLVRNSLLMATWGILSLNDWYSASLELHGSSPRHSSSAWMLRGWQGMSGWLPSLLPTAVRVVMHSYPEALMYSSGTSHVPRVKAAAAGCLPALTCHIPLPFEGWVLELISVLPSNISVVHQRLCRRQTNGIVHWHYRVLDVILCHQAALQA